MAQAAIAAKIHQTLDVHGGLTAQVAFDSELGHDLTYALPLSLRQILDFRSLGNASRFANLAGRGPANAINGGQRNNRVLMIRDINPSNTSHSQSPKCRTKNYNTSTHVQVDPDSNLPTIAHSSLALLMPRIITDHAHNALAAYNLALAAHLFD
jgi:hypothetical protein